MSVAPAFFNSSITLPISFLLTMDEMATQSSSSSLCLSKVETVAALLPGVMVKHFAWMDFGAL